MCDVNRRPTAITLKTFLLICWAPTALGLVPLPGSLERGPGVFGQTSAAATLLGCTVSLVGLLWFGRKSNGLYLEQAGLVMIFIGCGMYAIALTGVPRFSDALFAFGLSGGFAIAALTQCIFIGRYRRDRRGESNGQ